MSVSAIMVAEIFNERCSYSVILDLSREPIWRNWRIASQLLTHPPRLMIGGGESSVRAFLFGLNLPPAF